MNIDISKVAQELLTELQTESVRNQLRAEGVVLLYERIRKQIEQDNQPAGSEEAPGTAE